MNVIEAVRRFIPNHPDWTGTPLQSLYKQDGSGRCARGPSIWQFSMPRRHNPPGAVVVFPRAGCGRPLFKNVCPAIAHKPQFYSRLPVARLARPLIFRTKTPVADFFKDGDRTNFLRVHRTQGRRGFWRRQFPRAFRVDRSGSDRTRRARRVNYQGEIAVHYLLTEMQKSIAQSSSSPRL
jgi:hypothetical protein